MRDVDRNIAAALSASVVSSLIGFVSIPVYVHFLGVGGYGLIGFLTTLQAVLQILDCGIATTINREVARGQAAGKVLGALGVVRAAAYFYWFVAFGIAVLVLVAAPLVARVWLNGTELSDAALVSAVAMMGLVIAARWPAQFYQNGLMGAQRIVASSLLAIAYAIAANIGSIVVLAFISPTIYAFLLWQAAAAIAYVQALRWAMYKSIGRPSGRIDLKELARSMRFSLGVTAVTATGIVLSQADKTLVSRAVDLDHFGYYMLGVAGASLLYLIAAPVFNVAYPRFSELVRRGDEATLVDVYHLSTRLLSCLLFPFAMFISVCSVPLVELWTGKHLVATAVGDFLPMLVTGAALHGVMHMPYALQLAKGNTRLPLTVNAILLIIVPPMAWVLIGERAVFGGALAWLLFQVLYLLLGSWLTHRRLLARGRWRWLLLDVGVPALVTMAVGATAKLSFAAFDLSRNGELLAGATAMGVAFFLCVFASPALRTAARARFRPMLGSR